MNDSTLFSIAGELESRCQENSNLKNLFATLSEKAAEYGSLRVRWQIADDEERRRLDSIRTASHDAFISYLNALSRACRRAGAGNEWRAYLGEDRKVLGDFAAYLTLYLALKAR